MLRLWTTPMSRRPTSMAQLPGTLVRSMSSMKIVERDDMPYLHHGERPRFRDYTKFKNPRKRASKLFGELQQEAQQKSKETHPAIWEDSVQFRVGDSIELKMVSQGGVNAKEEEGAVQVQELEKIRGVVLGIVNRGLGSSVILRDVVFGEPIERKIPLYSPMIKEVKVLERNFIFKGKRKVKRAKLYYFRDLNPLCKYLVLFLKV
jgi:large subunit ribosomal protein L19